jgi:hypothetical protein
MALLLGWSRTSLGGPILVLDQSDTVNSSGEYLGGGTGIKAIAQTFTPAISGQLAVLNLLLNNNGSGNDPLVASIYDTQNGLPNNLLGTEDLYNISGQYFAWYSMDFTNLAINLNANTLYAFVFTHLTGGYIYMRGTVLDSYPRGMELVQTSSNPSWQPDTRSPDMCFETYMIVPEPTVVTLIVSGLSCFVLLGVSRCPSARASYGRWAGRGRTR